MSETPRRRADRSLLIMAWAGGAALLVIGLLLGFRAELTYRQQAQRQVEVQADILAASIGAALSFDDRAAMAEYVEALRANRRVAAAAVYNLSREPLVVFNRAGGVRAPKRVGPVAAVFQARHVEVTKPVTQRGVVLGWVYMATLPEPWSDALSRHGGLAMLGIMALLLLGVVTAAGAQLQARALELAQANGRLRAEMAARAEVEDALRQSQKMEALGQLTGGIAHDFNNLLQVVQGAFELIRRKPDGIDKVVAWAENGLEATERGATLTRQLLTFSRSQKLEVRPFMVSELIAQMRQLLERTLGAEISLTLDLQDADAAVLSDRTQLELAVLNMAINARDAMPDGGRLGLSTRLVSIGAEDPVLEAGDYVELRVADSGEGMSEAVIARAFDPFFTTKGVGRGTGLGLSQVYGVARQAGGAAQIESTPGKGTTIVLHLRKSDIAPEAPAGRPSSAPTPAARTGHTVLVVDDEPQVRALAREILEMLGYRVVVADSGETGLDILETLKPNLMLFDYAMPGMSGAELAQRARLRWPDVPIVFASGHADSAAVEAALGGQAMMLAKPFTMATLAETVAALMPPAADKTP